MARKIDDAGDKVGGARKDMWRDRALALDDLPNLSAREAERFVTKDLVWPAPDYEALAASGWEPKAVALLKVVRDRVAVSPDLSRKDPDTRQPLDPAEARRQYVQILGIAQAALADARTVRGFGEACARIKVAAGYDPKLARNERHWNLMGQADGPAARTRGAFAFGINELQRAETLVRTGFPAKHPAWRKGIELRSDPKAGWYAVKKVGRFKRIVADGFADEAALLAHLEAESKAAAGAKAAGPATPPDRPHLDDLERTGLPDRRGGAHVTPQGFLDAFGFRSVEFGEWLPDGERQAVLDMGHDALHDLADALGIEPRLMGFGGRLSAAFGARGGGGSRVAHYEPTRRIFNLTRLRGAGALAHEFAHALDDVAGEIGLGARADGLVYASGGHDRLKTLAGRLPGLGEAEAAWEAMMSALWQRPRTREEAVRDRLDAVAAMRADIARVRGNAALHVERRPEGQRDLKWLKSCEEWCEGRERAVARGEALAAELAASPADGDFGLTDTDYHKEAVRLCGKSGTYYRRPCEMLARAFEAAVHDVLAERGGRSDYLVHGVEADRYADRESYVGNPYPAGEDRARFLAAFRRLAAAMAGPLAALSPAPAEGRDEGPGAAPGMAA